MPYSTLGDNGPVLATLLLPFVRHDPEPMAALMERVRTAHGLPSICAGAVVDGRIVSLDAVGVRRLGSDERATVDDQYHCGSITKSFTAALFATFVQSGNCGWNLSVGRLFMPPDNPVDPGYERLTALQLMAHRSGLPEASWPPGDTLALRAWSGHTPSFRRDYARRFLALPPTYPPGTRMVYSNANYVVLGAAMENIGGKDWEQLLRERLLRPLGLRSAGFGAAGTPGKTDQPWGHHVRNGRLTPVPPGPDADNPLTLGPANSLHMSVPDLLRWCAFQADEGRKGGPLEPEAFKTLHTPPFGGDYAGGLIALPRTWAGGTAFYHRGDNTMNTEILWIAPKKRFGLVVACNADAPGADAALDAVAAELIRRYCPKEDPPHVDPVVHGFSRGDKPELRRKPWATGRVERLRRA